MAEKSTAEKRQEVMLAGWSTILGGAGWFAFAYFIWNLPWFWNATMYESGWWGLLAILLTSIAVMPVVIGFILIITAPMGLPKKRLEGIWVAFSLLPISLVWFWLWMVCLPTAWQLWPYDAWWKFLIAIPLLGMATPGIIMCLWLIFVGEKIDPNTEFGSRDLKRGMKGGDVRELQRLLNSVGGQSIGVDGSFGSQTEGAVRAFQEQAEFKVDGYVGKKTRAALLELKPPDEEPELDPSDLPPAFAMAQNLQRIYTDSGSGGHKDVSIWRASEGLCLGDHVKEGYSEPSRPLLVGTEQGDDDGTFSQPVDYDLAWTQERGNQSLWVWQPQPPDGFVALGFYSTTSSEKPALDAMRCVSTGTTTSTQVGHQIWNDAGTGGADGSFWSLPYGLAMISGVHSEPSAQAFRIRVGDTDAEAEASDDEPSTSPSLTTSRDGYLENEAITVSFDDGPGNPSDWIGIYRAEAPSDERNHHGNWLYVNGSRTAGAGLEQGRIVFPEGMSEGDYEMRFFVNNGYELLANHPFSVAAETEDSTLSDSEQPVEEEQRDEDEEVTVVEQEGDEAAIEVEEQPEAADSGLRSFIEELKEAKFSSDREKLIKPRLGESETVSLTVDKVDRTSGFGLSDELRRGRTLIGRTPAGAEVELRMPESMNDAIDALEKGSDFEANTAISGWNSLRKRIQLDWKQ